MKAATMFCARHGIQRLLISIGFGLLTGPLAARAQDAGPNPTSFPREPVAQSQVWFTPNIGSVDMLDLFTLPEQWASARPMIDVFKFYMGQIGSGGWSCTLNPTANCGPNHLQNLIDRQAFSKLGAWNIDIAIESFFAGPVESVNPIVCATSAQVQSLTLDGSINAIQNVLQNGGQVRYLAMDEPIRQWYPAQFYLVSGQPDPRPCLTHSLGTLADEVAAYILTMQGLFPSVAIGQVELYPEVGVAQIKEWVLALEARGVSLPFLHLDVHGPRVTQYIGFGINVDIAADLAELKSFFAMHGIAFGVIVTDINWDIQIWNENEYDDGAYVTRTMDWVNELRATGVELNHFVFQSWVLPLYTTGPGPNQVPTNLPDNNVALATHTRLITTAVPILQGQNAVPAISVWGAIAMALLMLTAGTILMAPPWKGKQDAPLVEHSTARRDCVDGRDVPAQAQIGFDDSDPTFVRIWNANYYEVAIRKTDGREPVTPCHTEPEGTLALILEKLNLQLPPQPRIRSEEINMPPEPPTCLCSADLVGQHRPADLVNVVPPTNLRRLG